MHYAKKTNDDKVSRGNHSSSVKKILGRTEHTITAHKYRQRERIQFSLNVALRMTYEEFTSEEK